MLRVRSISRKGWIRTSPVSSTARVHFTWQFNAIRALGWVGSSCLSSMSAKTRSGLRFLTSSASGSVVEAFRENHRGSRDTTMVFVVRRRDDLLNKVIPFFERQPLISGKRAEFDTFAHIVREMNVGEHLSAKGFARLKALALAMNGGGRYWRVHRPESSETICRTPAQSVGEEMVRPAWRHAEPGRNDLAPDADMQRRR